MRFSGILRRMAEMKDMYRLTCYVASEEYDKIDGSIKAVLTHSQAIQSLIDSYKDKASISTDKCIRIIQAAVEHEYIKAVGNDQTGTLYDITPIKGNHLIAKKFRLPVGLIDESLKTYGTTITLLAGGGAGAIILYAIQLIFGHR